MTWIVYSNDGPYPLTYQQTSPQIGYAPEAHDVHVKWNGMTLFSGQHANGIIHEAWLQP